MLSMDDQVSQLKQEATPLIMRNEWGHPGFTLTIDGKTVQAYENQTLLSVAIDNGILHIPNLCNDEKLEPTSACRMCLVYIQGIDRPLPSCNTPAMPGLVVTTDSDELFQIRRTNLELMLSDHNAYCQPPCQVDCPTHIDIPGYLELIAKGSMKEAARLVKEVLPFSYILGLFSLIELGYLQEQAQRESARCLQCACPAAGQYDLQQYSIEHGLSDNRFHDGEPSDYHDYDGDLSHSFILRDPNKCINCTQCVRVCHDVIGPDCYGMFGKGFDTIVSTPFNITLHDTDCVSCGACVQVCPTGSLMMAERYLTRYAFALDRCIFCGDCVEVCPHGALGETPNFELSFFHRFGEGVTLEKQDLAEAPNYLLRQRLPRGKKELPIMSPLVRPLQPRSLRE